MGEADVTPVADVQEALENSGEPWGVATWQKSGEMELESPCAKVVQGRAEHKRSCQRDLPLHVCESPINKLSTS